MTELYDIAKKHGILSGNDEDFDTAVLRALEEASMIDANQKNAEQSIEFAEWLQRHYIKKFNGWIPLYAHSSTKEETTSELYKKFIQSKHGEK